MFCFFIAILLPSSLPSAMRGSVPIETRILPARILPDDILRSTIVRFFNDPTTTNLTEIRATCPTAISMAAMAAVEHSKQHSGVWQSARSFFERETVLAYTQQFPNISEDTKTPIEEYYQKFFKHLIECWVKFDKTVGVVVRVDNFRGQNIAFGGKPPEAVRAWQEEAYWRVLCSSPKGMKYTQMGELDYKILGPSDTEIIKLALQHVKTDDTTYILDLGSATPDWAVNMAKYCAKIGRRVTIVSLTGDRALPDQKITIGSNCQVLHFGGIKIEALTEELAALGLANVQFAACVSKMCLLHLIDPLATFMAMYGKLSPMGIFAIDGFPLEIKTAPYQSTARFFYSAIARLTKEFLTRPFSMHGSYDRIVGVKEETSNPFPALRYHEIIRSGESLHRAIGFETDEEFPEFDLSHRRETTLDSRNPEAFSSQGLYGSETLYDRLYHHSEGEVTGQLTFLGPLSITPQTPHNTASQAA